MQQEALADIEDFGGPDPLTELPRAALAGKDAPYARYRLGAAYDEMFAPDGKPRGSYAALDRRLTSLPLDELVRRQHACEQSFLHQGITFTVYNDSQATERIIPTDLLPRIVTAKEWEHVERGLVQRIHALNLFLGDIYGDAKVLKDGIVPREMIFGSKHYRREMRGIPVPHGAYVNVCGSDLVRDEAGEFLVLEDNLRVPSGVSYMLTNRDVVRRAFPGIFRSMNVRAIEQYPLELLATLRALAPFDQDVSIAVLTPGVFNSAYFEHAFLARQMGVELVEGRDLLVNDNVVYTRTTSGLKRIDVIYRRIDDDFIDPLIFREDSSLGVPGLFNAYRAGNVVIANALGTGVADDKAIYAYVPRLIKYYLSEDPLLGSVKTFLCREEKSLAHVLDNLDKLVVKAVGESGGYGMLVGPHASGAERSAFAEKLKADPDNYIAQPTIALSTAPTFVGDGVEARHVDLRPFILTGAETKLVPGALTRVALKQGSLVVNSSQGGGSKDTWGVERLMLSRVADSLYWMSRYIERAEHTARMLAVKLESMAEQTPDDGRASWGRVVQALGDMSWDEVPDDAFAITKRLAFDRTNESSLIASLTLARDNARQVREALSNEVWGNLNRLYLYLSAVQGDSIRAHAPASLFRRALDEMQALEGVIYSTLSHNEGWYFLELGKYIERAQLLGRLLDVYFRKDGVQPKYFDWLVLLKFCTAFEPYTKLYTASVRPQKLAQFLLFDAEFPHSVCFSIDRVSEALAHVAPGAPPARRAAVERLAGRLKAGVDFGQIDELLSGGIDVFLNDITRQCEKIHEAVFASYITYGAETVL